MPKFKILPHIVPPSSPHSVIGDSHCANMSEPILIKNVKYCPKTVTGKFKSESQITIEMANQKFQPRPSRWHRYIYLSPRSEVRQFLNLRRSSGERGMIVLPEPSRGRVQRMRSSGVGDGDKGRQCTSIRVRSRLLDDG